MRPVGRPGSSPGGSPIAFMPSNNVYNFLDPRVPDHVWDKITPCPMSGCWLFFGALVKGGYGNLKIRGVNKRAHRYVWRMLRGRWPRKMLDHKCRQRCCVNPAHLRDVCNRTNTLAGEGPTARAYRRAREQRVS